MQLDKNTFHLIAIVSDTHFRARETLIALNPLGKIGRFALWLSPIVWWRRMGGMGERS